MTTHPACPPDGADAPLSEPDHRAQDALRHCGALLCSIWSAPAPSALTMSEWERLLAHARRTRLIARLAELYRARGWLATVPPGPAVHLHNALKTAQRQRDETLWEAARLRQALRHLPTPVVLLKGAAYVLADLPPARGRLFGDIDLLIDRAQLRAAEGALLAKGWVPARLDPYDERYYRDWMHELPPMQHVERRTHLDVHHAITPPTSRYAVDVALLMAERVALADHPGLSMLAPADMLLHSAAHLLQDGEFASGLRDLLDLRDLFMHFGREPQFWPTLAQRARQLGLSRPLYYVWRLATDLLAMPSPAAFSAEIVGDAPPQPWRGLMLRLLAVVLQGNDPAGPRRGEGMARWLLYVRSHWIRMPWYRILPHLTRKAWTRTMAKWSPRASLSADEAAAG